jgi:enoyl-CoA hydratase
VSAVRIEIDGAVGTILLDRPRVRNAIDRETAEALVAAVSELESSASVRVMVIHGEHGTFCAGADLSAIARGKGNRVERGGDAPLGPTRRVPSKPTIASIAGHAVAGGLELALFCDLRVAESSAVLGVFCRRWGVPLIDGGTVRLPRIVGLGRALDMVLTGRAVPASEALAMGLVNRVVPDGTVRAHAEALARDIAAFPWTCVLEDRASVYESMDHDFQAAMENELEHGLRSLAAPELTESIGKFVSGAGRGGSFTR